MTLVLRTARRPDLPQALRLLSGAALGWDGVAANWERYVVIAEPGSGTVCGVAGLEVRGAVAVLRSVAVAPSLRGRGHGGALVQAMVERARVAGADQLCLTTRGAEGFYRRHGFEPLAGRCPAEALAVPAFRRAWLGGSTAMSLRLPGITAGGGALIAA